MANLEQYIEEDIHPIDLVEHLAEHHDWDFDRIHDDQIAMAVEGAKVDGLSLRPRSGGWSNRRS